MIILGVVLIVLGLLLPLPLVLYIGIALAVIGLVLLVAPQGFQGGRRWY